MILEVQMQTRMTLLVSVWRRQRGTFAILSYCRFVLQVSGLVYSPTIPI